jgi:hypothetical protein
MKYMWIDMRWIAIAALITSACGSNPDESTQAAAQTGAPGASSPAASSPAATAAPAAPATIGAFGLFLLSINTIEADGQCFEMGSIQRNGTPISEAEAREGLTGPLHIPAEAISTNRCPVDGRLTANCTIHMLNGINYYYSTGPHAMTPESARAHCETNRGQLADSTQ